MTHKHMEEVHALETSRKCSGVVCSYWIKLNRSR
jgi:hypothetical protein